MVPVGFIQTSLLSLNNLKVLCSIAAFLSLRYCKVYAFFIWFELCLALLNDMPGKGI